AAAGIPEADHAVLAAGGNVPAIGMKGHTPDLRRVAGQRAGFLSRGCVPDLDCPVGTASREPSAVRTERDTRDPVFVPLQSEFFLAGCHLPNLGHEIRGPGGEALAVGAE